MDMATFRLSIVLRYHGKCQVWLRPYLATLWVCHSLDVIMFKCDIRKQSLITQLAPPPFSESTHHLTAINRKQQYHMLVNTCSPKDIKEYYTALIPPKCTQCCQCGNYCHTNGSMYQWSMVKHSRGHAHPKMCIHRAHQENTATQCQAKLEYEMMKDSLS